MYLSEVISHSVLVELFMKPCMQVRQVVFPGVYTDLESDNELHRFKDKIYLFEPNSSQKLIDALVKASRSIIPSERTLRPHLDNFMQYRERVSQIYFAHRQPG